MDVFFEQLVKVKIGTVRKVLIAATIIIAAIAIAVVTLAGITIVPMALSFLIDCGICYIAWWSICQYRWEYEYIITNGEFDVDKIINQRKRSRVVTFKCSAIEKIGKYNKEMQLSEGVEKIFACTASDECWYVIVRSIDNRKICLVFDPDERILEGIKKYLPKQMALEVFGSF